MGRRFWLGLLGYALPTFPLGYAWHLVTFADRYEALDIYRDDMIIPFGLVAMLLQGAIFSWLYGKVFAPQAASWLKSRLAFGAIAGVLTWTFTTLSVGAKHVMTAVHDYLALETAFTIVQFLIVGPLIALAWRVGTGRS